MSGYDQLNGGLKPATLEALNSGLSRPSFATPPNKPEDFPPEAFEAPLSPVPIPGLELTPPDLAGLNDFLEMTEPLDMSTPSGADQLALHVLLLTMSLKTVLERLDAAEEKLSEMRADDNGYD